MSVKIWIGDEHLVSIYGKKNIDNKAYANNFFFLIKTKFTENGVNCLCDKKEEKIMPTNKSNLKLYLIL